MLEDFMTRDALIKLLGKTERPEKVDGAKYGAACRDAVEYAFAHWLFDNGQDHSRNASLMAALVKKRDELLNNG